MKVTTRIWLEVDLEIAAEDLAGVEPEMLAEHVECLDEAAAILDQITDTIIDWGVDSAEVQS